MSGEVEKNVSQRGADVFVSAPLFVVDGILLRTLTFVFYGIKCSRSLYENTTYYLKLLRHSIIFFITFSILHTRNSKKLFERI